MESSTRAVIFVSIMSFYAGSMVGVAATGQPFIAFAVISPFVVGLSIVAGVRARREKE